MRASLLSGLVLGLCVSFSAHASFKVTGNTALFTPSTSPVASTKAVSHKVSSKVVDRAVGVIGTPYRWGGTTPEKGFDCSGLVQYAYANVKDLDLPRTSRELSRIDGKKIPTRQLQPGDLLFFRIKGRKVDHVAIYMGNDKFIHAPRRGQKVRIDNLSKAYWQKRYYLAKRVLPAASTQLADNRELRGGKRVVSR